MTKEYCRAKKCSYRKPVDINKAFCMLPNCPYDLRISKSKFKSKDNETTAQNIIAQSRALGLIP